MAGSRPWTAAKEKAIQTAEQSNCSDAMRWQQDLGIVGFVPQQSVFTSEKSHSWKQTRSGALRHFALEKRGPLLAHADSSHNLSSAAETPSMQTGEEMGCPSSGTIPSVATANLQAEVMMRVASGRWRWPRRAPVRRRNASRVRTNFSHLLTIQEET
jgi:hypothetical protein